MRASILTSVQQNETPTLHIGSYPTSKGGSIQSYKLLIKTDVQNPQDPMINLLV